MYINHCKDEDEFVLNKNGNLIQKKFMRTDYANPDESKVGYIKVLIENQSLMQQLVRKAEKLGITPEECVNQALEEFLK